MEDFFEFAAAQMDVQSTFEFDLGMCLSALQNMHDEPDSWSEAEYDFMMCLADDLLERFTAKYQDWMEEYANRKELNND
jgi:hypothetical protein